MHRWNSASISGSRPDVGSSSTSSSAREAERGDQGDLLAVALGVRPGPLGGIELEAGDQLVAARRVEVAAHPAEEVDRLAAGELGPQRDVAGHVGQPAVQRDRVGPRIASEQLDPSAVGPEQAEEDADRRRLAGPVGSEEPVDRPRLDVEVEAVQRRRRPEALDQAGDGHHRAHVLNTNELSQHCECYDCHMARHQAAVDSFVERYAADLEAAGIPRLPARVFVALLVEDAGYLSAAELAERLHISPAAVSGAVRYLIQVQLVRREREPRLAPRPLPDHRRRLVRGVGQPAGDARAVVTHARRRRAGARRSDARGRTDARDAGVRRVPAPGAAGPAGPLAPPALDLTGAVRGRSACARPGRRSRSADGPGTRGWRSPGSAARGPAGPPRR